MLHLLSLQVWLAQLVERVVGGPLAEVLHVCKVAVRSEFQVFVQISYHRIVQQLIWISDVRRDGVCCRVEQWSQLPRKRDLQLTFPNGSLSCPLVHPVYFVQNLQELLVDILDHLHRRFLASSCRQRQVLCLDCACACAGD